MSDAIIDDSANLTIDDQVVSVRTQVFPMQKQISYELKSDSEIEPETVAVALYLMCHDICNKNGIQLDELVSGLVESDEPMH